MSGITTPDPAASVPARVTAMVDHRSFAALVYPFLFDPARFKDRAGAGLASCWDEQRPLKVWQQARFPQEDLLAHVAEYLNPSEGVEPTALVWELTPEALSSPRGLGASADWSVQIPRTLETPGGTIP